jgi:hypothetical protein
MLIATRGTGTVTVVVVATWLDSVDTILRRRGSVAMRALCSYRQARSDLEGSRYDLWSFYE